MEVSQLTVGAVERVMIRSERRPSSDPERHPGKMGRGDSATKVPHGRNQARHVSNFYLVLDVRFSYLDARRPRSSCAPTPSNQERCHGSGPEADR